MAAADGGATRLEISASRLLLVEGRDEVNLFDALLKHCLGAPGKQDIQIIDAGGKDRFRRRILAIQAAAASHPPLRSLGVIRDADDNAGTAFQSVCDALRYARYEPPRAHGEVSDGNPAVGVFIVPDGADAGAIESLCRRSVARVEASRCVEAYIDCLKDRESCALGMRTRPSPMPISPPGRTPWRAWVKAPGRAYGISTQMRSRRCPLSSESCSCPPPNPADARQAPPSRARCRGPADRGRGHSRPRPSAGPP